MSQSASEHGERITRTEECCKTHIRRPQSCSSKQGRPLTQLSACLITPRSCARDLSGTIKEILGTAQSVGCTVDKQFPRDLCEQVGWSGLLSPLRKEGWNQEGKRSHVGAARGQAQPNLGAPPGVTSLGGSSQPRGRSQLAGRSEEKGRGQLGEA